MCSQMACLIYLVPIHFHLFCSHSVLSGVVQGTQMIVKLGVERQREHACTSTQAMAMRLQSISQVQSGYHTVNPNAAIIPSLREQLHQSLLQGFQLLHSCHLQDSTDLHRPDYDITVCSHSTCYYPEESLTVCFADKTAFSVYSTCHSIFFSIDQIQVMIQLLRQISWFMSDNLLACEHLNDLPKLNEFEVGGMQNSIDNQVSS